MHLVNLELLYMFGDGFQLIRDEGKPIRWHGLLDDTIFVHKNYLNQIGFLLHFCKV